MVREPNLGSVSFVPGDPSSIANFADVVRYIRDLENRLAGALNLLALGHLDTTHVAPEKPRDGDFRVADGVHWNPGSGGGLYRFNGTTWRFYVDS